MPLSAKLVDYAQKVRWRSFVSSTKALLVFLPIGLAVWGVWVCPKLDILPSIAINDNTPYLLSAVAQSLAAVLALVFTISLIAAQLSSRYSYRILAGFFDKLTIGYIVLFIIAVILPFSLLAEPCLNGVKASLVLAGVCLFLLVPYFLGFQEKLAPEHMLRNLQKAAVKQLLTDVSREPKEVVTIENIVMSAFALKDYDTFHRGVSGLADLAYEAGELDFNDAAPGPQTGIFDQFLEQASQTHIVIYHRLRDIALVTMEDAIAPKKVLMALRNNGIIAVDMVLKKIAQESIQQLGELGVEAAKKGRENIAFYAVDCLHSMCPRLADEDQADVTDDVLSHMESIGLAAAESGLALPVSWALESTGRISLNAISGGLEELAMTAAKSLLAIGERAETTQLTGEVELMASWLFMLGASTVQRKNVDLQNRLTHILRAVQKKVGSAVMRPAFLYTQKNATIYPEYSATEKDLDTFVEPFKLELSESDDKTE